MNNKKIKEIINDLVQRSVNDGLDIKLYASNFGKKYD